MQDLSVVVWCEVSYAILEKSINDSFDLVTYQIIPNTAK